MCVEEIVEGKVYRLLTDIGGVGYTPGDGTEFPGTESWFYCHC